MDVVVVSSVIVLEMVNVVEVVVWDIEKFVRVVLVVVADTTDSMIVVSIVLVVVVLSVLIIDIVFVVGIVTIDVEMDGCKMKDVVADRKTTVLVV